MRITALTFTGAPAEIPHATIGVASISEFSGIKYTAKDLACYFKYGASNPAGGESTGTSWHIPHLSATDFYTENASFLWFQSKYKQTENFFLLHKIFYFQNIILINFSFSWKGIIEGPCHYG